MTRTSTLIVRADPSRSTSPSCSTRSTLAWVFGAHVADFVEEDRAAVGLLELADLLLGRAGERSLLVAEQLGLDQLLGNGRAVDLDEALAAAQAVAVDGARDELLADAALALDQHRRVGRRGAADRGHHLLQRGAVADHLVADFDRLLERSVLVAQPRAARARSAWLTSTRSLANGFSRKSKRALLGRLDGGARSCRGRRSTTTGSVSFMRAQPLEHLDAVHARHLDVEQDQVGGLALGEREPFLAGGGADELVAFVLERHPQRIADGGFVVDDQDA